MRLSLFLFCLLILTKTYAQEKSMCVSVDDLPFVGYGISDEAIQKASRDLLATFVQQEIPAIGFVNDGKLYNKTGQLRKQRYEVLKLWLNNGFELGNHTYSHYNFHKVAFQTYVADILKGEKVSKGLSASYGLPYRYFRHPFLKIGKEKNDHDSLRNFLHKHGYEEAPVTIDNEEYLFAKAYAVAARKKDQSLMKQIGEDYVSYMLNKLAYFEKSSELLFGRNINHILLIHANKLNADYFGKLASEIKKRGYQFIDMAETLRDPAYQHEISHYGKWGISWLDRWAMSEGKKGDFFKDDPPSPDYIKKLAQ